MKKGVYFKGALPTGWDNFTRSTINYRESIGKTVHVPEKSENPTLCSSGVIHAAKLAQNVFLGSKIPCSLFIVEGTPVIENQEKSGFKEFFVREEVPIENFDQIFGFKYSEVLNPLDPRKIEFEREITKEEITLVKKWGSVRGSVWDSVLDSVRDSVRDSVLDSVWGSVWGSVWDSVRGSVWDSVLDSEYAYLGNIFTGVKKWKYIEKIKVKGYPFQSCVDLLKLGLVPVCDGTQWFLVHPRLEGKGKIVWSGKV